ncbi:protease inhibitor [Streptomyces triticagri]|uniref:Protease inhibitor n=1 Tax=Streptomyces triticagri TaxID=2293568 RepID=A0A372M3X0_9ACTN|nr:SSI family serine proteinase inhibitor [Streptomyces triticagri]RFU85634.1 protease inhibitor [Streptomyces triticagri]
MRLHAVTAVTAVTAVVTALLALAVSPAAAADGGAADPQEPAGLFLTVSGSDRTWIRGVELRCTPEPAGSHPRAAEACAALHDADGDPGALAGEPRPCTKEYDPVTVTAKGTYDGTRGRYRMRGTAPVELDWSKTFPNACAMHAAADPVFDF